MKNRFRRLLVPLAVLCSFALVAAACGDDDDDASSEETTTAEETTTDEEMADTEDEMEEETGSEAAGGDIASVEGAVNISGSSTVEPVSAKVAELAEDAGSAIQVTVDGPGTGDGFAVFCEGETDISDASRAIKEEEAATCEENGINYVELKIAFDGIAVLTNPANADVTCLTFEQIYALMGPEAEGTVSNWSDADAALPDASFDISAPGPESGTYDSFIEIVLEGLAEENGIEEEPFIRQDFSGNADDNVLIQGITGSDSSFGWVGFAFAEANADSVKVIEVDEGEGCVTPTIETIADGSYPVARDLFIYVNTDKAAENEALTAYVDFYLGEAYEEAVTQAFGDAGGYVALPDDILAETLAAWEGR